MPLLDMLDELVAPPAPVVVPVVVPSVLVPPVPIVPESVPDVVPEELDALLLETLPVVTVALVVAAAVVLVFVVPMPVVMVAVAVDVMVPVDIVLVPLSAGSSEQPMAPNIPKIRQDKYEVRRNIMAKFLSSTKAKR